MSDEIRKKGERQALPMRSKRFGIGKEIGGAVYVHRSYAYVLGELVANAAKHLPNEFEYDVVKVNFRTDAVSFIRCEDFDSADEPTVGNSVIVGSEGQLRKRQMSADPEIYHHKWLFVADGYAGFDVSKSKQRSRIWLAMDDVDMRRIGRKSYWEQNVVPRLRDSSA